MAIADIPPAMPVTSRLEGGFIVPPTHLALIVVDHCNLSCRSCNHASPVAPRWRADPTIVYRDFSILAKYYRPRWVKVLGGEALLHPDLAGVIQAARSTNISPHFLLVTNGVLLDRMEDAVWREIDEVEISWYPNIPNMTENVALAREQAARFNTKLTVNRYEQFRMTLSTVGTDDLTLIDQIYSTCKQANLWGCHSVRQGYLYKCPQSMYIPMLVARQSESDRIPIVDTQSFQSELLGYLNSQDPLTCCKYCAGTVGKQEDHTMLPRSQWTADTAKPTEELVDWELLSHSVSALENADDCKIPTNLGDMSKERRHRPSWKRGLSKLLGPRLRASLRATGRGTDSRR